MTRQLYFGLNELEGDLYIAISTDPVALNDDYSGEEWRLIEGLEEHEIYESIDGIFQAQVDSYNCEEIIELLEDLGFKYSKDLNDEIIEE